MSKTALPVLEHLLDGKRKASCEVTGSPNSPWAPRGKAELRNEAKWAFSWHQRRNPGLGVAVQILRGHNSLHHCHVQSLVIRTDIGFEDERRGLETGLFISYCFLLQSTSWPPDLYDESASLTISTMVSPNFRKTSWSSSRDCGTYCGFPTNV